MRKGIINPSRVTEGYIISEYELKVIELYLPVLIWGEKYDKNMRSGKDKSEW